MESDFSAEGTALAEWLSVNLWRQRPAIKEAVYREPQPSPHSVVALHHVITIPVWTAVTGIRYSPNSNQYKESEFFSKGF